MFVRAVDLELYRHKRQMSFNGSQEWVHTVSRISSDVLQGTVLFSTSIAPGLACKAISFVTASNAVTSVALPAPNPLIFVGVFTAMSTISASLMVLATSVEKYRFGSRAVILISPSSWHWLSHSEVVELDEDSLEDCEEYVGFWEILQAREPSRLIRRM